MDLFGIGWGKHPNHPYQSHVEAFATASFSSQGLRFEGDPERLASLMTNKPWEVLVGQAIAAIATDSKPGRREPYGTFSVKSSTE